VSGARRRGPAVAVVGAGAFGGWTALHLLRSGCRVTLVDAWGPGHSRSSSGGETRVLRHTYAERAHVELVVRALQLWRQHEALWNTRFFRRTGLLWLVQDDEAYERLALDAVRAAGVELHELPPDEVARRWPQVALDGVRWALFEPEAGPLLARASCERVGRAVADEGGELLTAQVQPGAVADGRMGPLLLQTPGRAASPAASLVADRYVFACGPWLGRLFPGVVPIESTRQEVFFFGTPPGDVTHAGLPVWADHGERFWYGIPGGERRGFKLADDTRGPPFDPTDGERLVSTDGLARAREYLARRFPGLAGAPLLESRVCQYEQSPDGQYLVGRHPQAENVWLVGGGSGHGFKAGPALGELVAGALLDERAVPAPFAWERLARRTGDTRGPSG